MGRAADPDGLARFASEVVELTNGERARAGLPPLAADARLTAAAQGHSADMVARDFYSHTSPDGTGPRTGPRPPAPGGAPSARTSPAVSAVPPTWWRGG